jgi:integration host factor subunit alpha
VTVLTKNDLINAVAAHGLSKRQSASVVESLFDIIFRCFEKGEDVKIVGFGHFRIRRKASRRGRNPQTGDSIEITARKVLTFKPSKGLKIRINHHAQ